MANLTIAEKQAIDSFSKCFIVKLNYLDSTNFTPKQLLLSDKILKLPTISALDINEVIPYPVLTSIPSFNREIDLFKNDTSWRSKYQFKLNTDDYDIQNILFNNIFIGQTIEVYIATNLVEFSTEFEVIDGSGNNSLKLLGKATFKGLTGLGKEIIIEAEDSKFLDYKNKLNTTTFKEYQVNKDDIEKNKIEILGKWKNLKPTCINQLDDSEWWDSGLKGKVVWSSSPTAEEQYFIIKLQNPSDDYKFRTMMGKDSTLAFKSELDYYQSINKESDLGGYTYLDNRQTNAGHFAFSDTPGPYYEPSSWQPIYIKGTNTITRNNSFLITANKTKLEEVTKLSSITNNKTITLVEDFSFLEAGDILIIEDLNLKASGYGSCFYTIKVKTYNVSTKVLTIEDDYLLPVSFINSFNSNSNNLNVYFKYLNSLTYDKKTKVRDFSYSRIKVPTYASIDVTNKKAAQIWFSTYTDSLPSSLIIKAYTAGSAGNKIKINWEINETTSKSVTFTKQSLFDGTTNIIIKVNNTLTNLNTLEEIKNAINASSTVNTTITATSSGSKAFDYIPDNLFLENGASQSPYLSFIGTTDINSTTIDLEDNKNRFFIAFKKNGVGGDLPTESGFKTYVDYLNTDTNATIAAKIVNAINSYFPLFSSTIATYDSTNDVIILRKTVFSNCVNNAKYNLLDLSAQAQSQLTTNFNNYILFTEKMNGSDIIATLNSNGFVLSFGENLYIMEGNNLKSQYVASDVKHPINRTAIINSKQLGIDLERGDVIETSDTNFQVDTQLTKLDEMWRQFASNPAVNSNVIQLDSIYNLMVGDRVSFDCCFNYIINKDVEFFEQTISKVEVVTYTITAINVFNSTITLDRTIEGLQTNQNYYDGYGDPQPWGWKGKLIRVTDYFNGEIQSGTREHVSFTKQNQGLYDTNIISIKKNINLEKDSPILFGYKDSNSAIGSLIKYVCQNTYNISSTNFIDSDFTTLNTLINLQSLLRIDGKNSLFDTLKDYLNSYSISCFIDKNGKLRFKFISLFEEAGTFQVLPIAETLSYDLKIEDYKANKILYSLTNDDSIEEPVENEYKTDLIYLLEQQGNVVVADDEKVQLNWSSDFSQNLINSIPLKNIVFDKLSDRKTRLTLNLSVLNTYIELGDTVTVESENPLIANNDWIVSSINFSTNNSEVELYMKKIYNPQTWNLTDESGNELIDENSNNLTWR